MKPAKLLLAASMTLIVATVAGSVAFDRLVPKPEPTPLADLFRDAPEQVEYRQKQALAARFEQIGAVGAAVSLAAAVLSPVVPVFRAPARRLVWATRFLSKRPRDRYGA